MIFACQVDIEPDWVRFFPQSGEFFSSLFRSFSKIFSCEKWPINRDEIVTAVKKMGLETMDIRDVIARSLEEHRYDVMRKIATLVETKNLEI
jgi:hypothetical protein